MGIFRLFVLEFLEVLLFVNLELLLELLELNFENFLRVFLLLEKLFEVYGLLPSLEELLVGALLREFMPLELALK